ncbi:hypothetical protein HUW51_09725 [Adhaeribacter swui]|uniref:Monoheme cytochrome C n=1 Tax=Adhaeribacter swui TaxID=2086471 RepID=A0A7G7G765_9BACT|nr:hypothetical protein [Adhaeribacter swui]QNF32999.1 hypothetical protein HUW51_09725 [Adhaeribacter swui]
MNRKIEQADRIKLKWVVWAMALLVAVITVNNTYSRPAKSDRALVNWERPASLNDSIDKKTGLIIAPGFAVVSTTCVRCHSPKLITEKRATREGWLATIRWMQQTQGLWDLGPQEPVVLDYLAKNYAPKNEGRRPLLKTTEWYKLNN